MTRAGSAVRKVVERNGATVKERIYLGGMKSIASGQGGVLATGAPDAACDG